MVNSERQHNFEEQKCDSDRNPEGHSLCPPGFSLDTVYQGDCLEIMKTWPASFVNCCVTSPPYWSLRDYGVEGQLGLEPTPEEYVDKMVQVFREVKRVLRDDGTLWLNLGDSYWGGKGQSGSRSPEQQAERTSVSLNKPYHQIAGPKQTRPSDGKHDTIKPKDLVGIPWAVAFALRADGWYLRQDIIWAKPNPMPESITDRCTKAHEYIFLLSKNKKYYYDADAIREEATKGDAGSSFCEGKTFIHQQERSQIRPRQFGATNPQGTMRQDVGNTFTDTGYRNKRSVWTVPTAPYSEAHFATFPPKLIEPCILAGCPEQVCNKCGKPRERITQTTRSYDHTTTAKGKSKDGPYANQTGDGAGTHDIRHGVYSNNKTTGWTDCGCNAGFRPGIVLDPFMGSGTTAMVAYENNRHYIGCELNPDYIELDRAEKAKEKYALFEK